MALATAALLMLAAVPALAFPFSFSSCLLHPMYLQYMRMSVVGSMMVKRKTMMKM